MKVLVTGMASSHTKPSANTTFFGTLVKAVETFADVEWATPSVTWTKEFLDQYDSILVGVIPPTSLGANKVYGAMHTINLMYESPKLRLIVDHPQIWQFKSSLASIDRDVSSLFSDFYTKRREFKSAISSSSQESIRSAATKLLNTAWPKTIYPSMPWKDKESVSKFISTVDPSSLIGVNLDSHLLVEPSISDIRSTRWVADSPKSSWTKKVEQLLQLPVSPLKIAPKESESIVSSRLASSFGLLAAPHDRGVGTWWSYRYIQAMNSLVPVFSDWRDTGKLSNSWYVLGSSIEEASDEERLEIAINQRRDYISAIPNKEESIELLRLVVAG
jgi:hypothetical protein